MDAVFLPSDAELAASLAQLKTQVASNASTADANLSEGLLKRALWAKHNDVKASERLLGAYSDWHTRTLGSPSMRLSIVHVHAFLLTGILEVLPNVKDRDGLPIVYMRPNSYLPGVIPWQHVVNALVYLLEFLTTTDETAAKYGFTFICDMKDWGWSNFGTSYAANFFAILSGRFPVRIRKFILVNPPSIFPLVWKVMRACIV
ncbi:CRAL-TRIO domain-containing protein [Chytriomyces sp. MP71]|nr:CRAL-TRIO domain-containing protein [Chytriomyces sp. MP71]